MAHYPIRNQLLDIIYAIGPMIRRRTKLDIERVIVISQQLELIRILLLNEDPDFVNERVGNRVRSEAIKLLEMNEWQDLSGLLVKRFRSSPPEAESSLVEATKNGHVTIGEAFKRFIALLDERVLQRELALESGPITSIGSRLSTLVPNQKIGPVRFSIKGEVLEIEHSPALAATQDRNAAGSARTALVDQGRNIIEGMKRSNCDLRFIGTIEELQKKLECTQDIIQLGIANLTCEELRKQFDAELPDILAGKLRAHLASIGMYVAQFPEWSRYTENAAQVELSEDDIRRSREVATDLIENLAAIPDRVDPEVPRTIKFIMDAVSDPAKTSKRAAYALFSTLENLFSKIFSYASAFADDLISQTTKKAAAWGASALATILVKAVLEGAGILAPIYARLPDAGWIRSAVEIIKQISV